MYHTFFISCSTDGHLGFYVLAIVNSAAVSAGLHVSFRIMVFSRYMPKSGIARSYGSCIFSFLRKSILFFIVVIPNYIPTKSVEGFPFLHTIYRFIVCRLFDNGHSDRCEVTPHCSFDLHFSDN